MKRGKRRPILAALLGLVGAALVAEVVCRIDGLFPGKVYEARAMRAFLEARASAIAYAELAAYAPPVGDPHLVRPVPDPWSGWTLPALIDKAAEGTRWFRGGEHESTYDVVLFGGSFAAQLGNHQGRRLCDGIAALPEVGSKPVKFWHFSVAAQKQPSHLHRLTALLAEGWKPDLVVLVDGYNEIAVSSENARLGSDPVYPSIAIWGAIARSGDVDVEALDILVEMRQAQRKLSARARSGLALGVWRSALFSRAWSAAMSFANAEHADARQRYMQRVTSERSLVSMRGPGAGVGDRRPRAEDAPPPGVAEGLAAWAEGARFMRLVCERRGITLVHAIQPGLDDEGSKVPTDEELRTNSLGASWRAAVRAGYPILREHVAELAREGVPVHDGSRIFADSQETLYVDGCHLNERGYALYGAQVGAWVRETLAAR